MSPFSPIRRVRDLTNELLKADGLYSNTSPGDLEKTYLRFRRGKEAGIRLGRSALTTKEQQIETERMLFLLAMSRVTPQVLRSLRDDVLPVFLRSRSSLVSNGGK